MREPRHILIISSGNPSRNPRPMKEASLLAEAGHAVSFLCPRGDSRLHEEDDQLASDAGFRLLRSTVKPGFLLRLSRWLACRAVSIGFQHALTLGSARDLLARARGCPAELTIVHNELPHLIGIRLLGEGRKVIADFEDWYSEDLLPADRSGRPLRLLRRNERTLLRTALLCTTTSEALSSSLASRYQAPAPLVISNAFPLQPAALPKAIAGPPSLFWFSQTIGPGRGLEPFIDTWALCKAPSRLVLLGTPVRDYTEALRNRLAPAIRQNLAILPTVSNKALPALIAQHHLGLALEDSSIPNRDLTITNKILQYLNAGLGVLATPTRGQHEVLAKAPAAGMFLDLKSPQLTAASLDLLLRDPAAITQAGQAARSLAERDYCWEKQGAKLLSRINLILTGPRP